MEVAAALHLSELMELLPQQLEDRAVPVLPLWAALLESVVLVGVEVEHPMAKACLFSCSISH